MVRALLFLVVLVVLAARRAPAAEPLTHLVAGRAALHALRGNTVVTFDAGGRERWRCSGFEAPPERDVRTRAAIVDADAALALAGLPDDELDTPEAEDALADEGIVIRRQLARAVAAATVVRALAAADDVWIATSAGLYQGRDGACRRVGLAGRDVLAVSAAADSILAATADMVWRGAAGATPRVVAGLTQRPRAIAAIDGERGYVADDDGVLEIGPYGVRGRVLDQATTAIAVCGGVVIALARDGTYRWTPGEPPARIGERPPARVLACGANTSARFVATGDGLYTSHDGVTWIERVEGRGRIVAGAAAAGGHLWLAIDDRLIALDADSRRAAPSRASRRRPVRAARYRPAAGAIGALAAGVAGLRRAADAAEVRLVGRRAVRVSAGTRGAGGRRSAAAGGRVGRARRRAGGRSVAAVGLRGGRRASRCRQPGT